MAIKGKAKGRSRRVVAAPPRPPVYVRKKPLFQRRWFLVTLGVLAAGGILAGVLTSLASSHRKSLRNRTSAAVTQFAAAVEGAFPPAPASQPLPPTGYAVYPTLTSDLEKVAKGDKDIDGMAKGKNLAETAAIAATAIGKINVERIVPEDANVSEAPGTKGSGATRLVLLESRFLLQQSFRTFASVGALMHRAAALSGKERSALIEDAKQLAVTAQTLFRRGYQKIVTLKAELGTLERNAFPAGAGGLGGA